MMLSESIAICMSLKDVAPFSATSRHLRVIWATSSRATDTSSPVPVRPWNIRRKTRCMLVMMNRDTFRAHCAARPLVAAFAGVVMTIGDDWGTNYVDWSATVRPSRRRESTVYTPLGRVAAIRNLRWSTYNCGLIAVERFPSNVLLRGQRLNRTGWPLYRLLYQGRPITLQVRGKHTRLGNK